MKNKLNTDLCFYRPPAKPHYVYLIQCGNKTYYKIGIAANIEERLYGLQLGNPFLLSIIDSRRMGSKKDALRVETELHNFASSWEIHREWYNLSPKILGIITELLNKLV